MLQLIILMKNGYLLNVINLNRWYFLSFATSFLFQLSQEKTKVNQKLNYSWLF